MSELCTTTLILGAGGGAALLVTGFVIALITLCFKASAIVEGLKSITTGNVIPIIVLVFGLVLVVIGLVTLLADRYSSVAGAIGNYAPYLTSHEDAPISADLHEELLGKLNAKTGDSYVVRISPSAQVVKVTGAYRNAECKADLIYRIVRNEPSLVVDVDAKEKILRVCTKADEPACKNRSL
jgi:hypothetical protein